MSAIRVENLCKSYRKDKVQALDNLCIKIEKGSLFGLIGLNGAGKSTLIAILSGLIRRDAGKVFILEDEIEDHDYLYKRRVGFVLDQPLYIDKLTAREYLEFVAGMYGLPEDDASRKIEELLDFFDLKDADRAYIETYSKGMKQKVSLAAAIIHDPDLLILDEPFEGIDVPSAEAIRRILVQMAGRGVTVLITSHVLEIIETLCTECAIIDKGRIVFQSRIDALATRLKEMGKDRSLAASLRDVFLQIISSPQDHKTLSWL